MAVALDVNCIDLSFTAGWRCIISFWICSTSGTSSHFNHPQWIILLLCIYMPVRWNKLNGFYESLNYFIEHNFMSSICVLTTLLRFNLAKKCFYIMWFVLYFSFCAPFGCWRQLVISGYWLLPPNGTFLWSIWGKFVDFVKSKNLSHKL